MYLESTDVCFSFILVHDKKGWPCNVVFSPLEDGSFEVRVRVAHDLKGKFGYTGHLSVQVAKDYARSAWEKPMTEAELFPEG